MIRLLQAEFEQITDTKRAVIARWTAEGLLEQRQVAADSRSPLMMRFEYRVIGDLSGATGKAPNSLN